MVSARCRPNCDHPPPLFPILLPPLPSPLVSAFVAATIMAPQLDAAQRILIRTLLTEGFETSLIASKASCSLRAVQRNRLESQQSEMPTRKTARAGRRSCMTPTMHRALRNIQVSAAGGAHRKGT
jgi:hypothetical protein